VVDRDTGMVVRDNSTEMVGGASGAWDRENFQGKRDKAERQYGGVTWAWGGGALAKEVVIRPLRLHLNPRRGFEDAAHMNRDATALVANYIYVV
jgi:hypothetical protein